MIKLRRLYSNNDKIFPEINFRVGLNIIFASVTKEFDNKSSHSLGKSTLVDIIDYCFLKQIDKSSFLKNEVFEDFIFFLEVQASDDRFITIKRCVGGKISINVDSESSNIFRKDDINWQYNSLSLTSAKEELSELITPKIIKENGFHFRNGLRYCLRKQTQYEKTFKVNTSREGDLNWKPYLSSILGIDPDIVKDKYQANKKVEAIKNAIKEIKELPKDSGQSLEAEIAQIEASLARMKSEVDKFDFKRSDESVSKELIEDVSAHVAKLNKQVYDIDRRLIAINNSLSTEFSFELGKVIEIFEEVQIYFPDQLTKSYEDLIKINTEMSSGRKNRLKTIKKGLISERTELDIELDIKRNRQQELTALLLQKDAFEKYKILQERLAKEDVRLAVLKERLSRLDMASELGNKLEAAKTIQKNSASALELATRVRGNSKLTNAVKIFSSIVEEVLSISAFFYTETNNDGNIEFRIGLKDQTSVNQGFSYTRVLSAIFDVTLLMLYQRQDFYRFVYHDGLLESLDDRVKLKLIDTWRDISETNGLQLILSVLDSDLPLTETGKKYFRNGEIIRELHDKGDTGRLFKMKAF